MRTANKCGLQNVHVAVIGRYLSLSARAHLSASDNVGSTFFFLPHGSKKTEITGNIYMQFYTVITRTRREKERVWGGGGGDIIRPAPRVVYSTERAER